MGEQGVLRERVGDVPYWWHSIDLGDGVVTPGHKSLDELEARLADLQLGDLRGKTVLDIGAWDGFFSFAAERLGAARVVALDHYMWAYDFGGDPDDSRDGDGHRSRPDEDPVRWRPGEWPGKRGFDLAHAALDSGVETVTADFMTTDLKELGTFDVVLYLKVLYHMEDPLRALRRVRAVTREVAVIETKGIELPGLDGVPAARFLPGDELAGDPTNWWLPNRAALDGMVRAAGFTRVETKLGPPQTAGEQPAPWRAVLHAA